MSVFWSEAQYTQLDWDGGDPNSFETGDGLPSLPERPDYQTEQGWGRVAHWLKGDGPNTSSRSLNWTPRIHSAWVKDAINSR